MSGINELDIQVGVNSIIEALSQISHSPKMIFTPYQGGFDIPTYEFEDFENEIEILDFVSLHKTRLGFGGFFQSNRKFDNSKCKILAAYNYDSEYYGYRSKCIVGFISNWRPTLKIPHADGIMAKHKPNCFSRKFNSIEDLLRYSKSHEEYMQLLHEIGWSNTTNLGCATYCDCGLKQNK